MTKAELISAVAENSGLKKVEAEKAVAAFIASVTTALKKGDKLSLVGFGTFCTAKRAARKAPRTHRPARRSTFLLPLYQSLNLAKR